MFEVVFSDAENYADHEQENEKEGLKNWEYFHLQFKGIQSNVVTVLNWDK